MKKLLFIYNATSGKATIRKYLADIIDIFIKAGYRVEAYQTQAPLDAKKQVIERAAEFDMIVCSGGDGTLNEVTSGAMQLEKKPLLGYIPSGSTNDFAGSIGLKKNMIENARIAMNGRPYRIDMGEFNGERNFVYIAAFGLFTEVSYSTPQSMKNILGHQAYILEGIKSLSSVNHYKMRVEIDGEVIEDDFLYGMVSNSNSAGGFKGITGGNVVLDDGLHEVTLVKMPQNPKEFQAIVTALLKGKKCPYIYKRKASCVNFHCDKKVTWVLDGECGGEHKDVTIKNHMNALVLIGARKDKANK